MADYQKAVIKLQYNDIKLEIKKLGLTQQYVADLLGISKEGLLHRIKTNKPSIHWEIYGISHYFAKDNNLKIK